VRVVCHRCGTETRSERVGVRETCDGCGAYLHSCRGCRLYAPGAHNDCREPQAEVVADKEGGNFCDYFQPSSASPRRSAGSSDVRERLERLFRKE
jgi:hypothetical protein